MAGLVEFSKAVGANRNKNNDKAAAAIVGSGALLGVGGHYAGKKIIRDAGIRAFEDGFNLMDSNGQILDADKFNKIGERYGRKYLLGNAIKRSSKISGIAIGATGLGLGALHRRRNKKK